MHVIYYIASTCYLSWGINIIIKNNIYSYFFILHIRHNLKIISLIISFLLIILIIYNIYCYNLNILDYIYNMNSNNGSGPGLGGNTPGGGPGDDGSTTAALAGIHRS